MATLVELGEVKATRIHYAVEYTDRRGRRRRQRRTTLNAAEHFRRSLRMGSDAIIRMITRQARKAI